MRQHAAQQRAVQPQPAATPARPVVTARAVDMPAREPSLRATTATDVHEPAPAPRAGISPQHVMPAYAERPAAPTDPAAHPERRAVVPTDAAQTRRPGLDLHTALSDTHSSLAPTATTAAVSVRRAPATAHTPRAESVSSPARLPGLDLQSALAAPTPRSALQLAPAPEDARLPAPPPMPPPLAVVPTPPSPPPAQRVLTDAPDPERTERTRLPEAPDDELEELADRLYDHIRARFRTELLIDRERAGLLADRY
jgi:hypothetical protein